MDTNLFKNCQLCISFSEVIETQEACNKMVIKNEHTVGTYHKIRQQLDTLGVQFRSFISMPQHLKPFLQPGRLVKVCIYLCA